MCLGARACGYVCACVRKSKSSQELLGLTLPAPATAEDLRRGSKALEGNLEKG